MPNLFGGSLWLLPRGMSEKSQENVVVTLFNWFNMANGKTSPSSSKWFRNCLNPK